MEGIQAIESDPRNKELFGDIISLQRRSKETYVCDEVSLLSASQLISLVAKMKKQVEERQGFFIKPLSDTLSKYRSWFKSFLDPLDAARKTLDDKIKQYRANEEKKRWEEQLKLQALADKEQARLAKKAEKKGELPPPPMPIPLVAKQESSINTGQGQVRFRSEWTFEIINEDEIDRFLCSPDPKKIRAAIKAGVRVAKGIRIFEREILSASE